MNRRSRSVELESARGTPIGKCTILLDYESAALAAIHTDFPEPVIDGYLFHHSHAVQRNVGRNSGATVCKQTRPLVARVCRCPQMGA